MKSRTVLSVIDLTVRRNEHFQLHIPRLTLMSGTLLGIVGPNGSGKSTFIQTMSGILVPTKGSIAYNGVPLNQNVRQWKTTFGYIPDDESWLIEELCATEYIALLSQTYHDAGVRQDLLSEAQRLANLLQFSQWDQSLGSLSHGNKKKVQLIAGLLHRPAFIIIDELRNGLDPLAIIQAEQIIADAKARGACVIAATHDIWWADRVADEVMFLSDGKPILHQTPAAIRKSYTTIEQAFIALASRPGDQS